MKYGDSRFRAWIISNLRRMSFKWPQKNAVKKAAKVKVGEFKTGRDKFGYQCNICKEIFKAKDTVVDHILPVINPEVVHSVKPLIS